MDLERINLVVRPRREWEAIDLGLRLAQRHAGQLYGAWLVASLPWAIGAFALAFYSESLVLAFVLFWWLKPLFENVHLHYLSRLIFADRSLESQPRRMALALPFRGDWVWAITFGRFQFARSFNAPVGQLEGLRRGERRKRLDMLHAGASAAGTTLSFTMLLAMLLIFFTVVSLVVSLSMNEFIVFNWASTDAFIDRLVETIMNDSSVYFALVFGLYYLAEGFIAPFYVSAGFMLYLNRRTHLEAWDIELQFRRALKRRTAASSVLATMLCGLLLTNSGEAAFAQEADADDSNTGTVIEFLIEPARDEQIAAEQDVVKRRISEILADDSFGYWETRTVWRRRNADEDAEEDEPEVADSDGGRLLDVIFGSLFEAMMWGLLVVALAFIYAYRETWLPYLLGTVKSRKKATGSRSGLLLDEEEMPMDVPASVRALWHKGKRLEAASLLYRATLTMLNKQHGLKIGEGDTEGDCLRRVRSGTSAAIAGYFARITTSWQSLAYAHRAPSDEQIEQLCDDWRATLEPQA